MEHLKIEAHELALEARISFKPTYDCHLVWESIFTLLRTQAAWQSAGMKQGEKDHK